MRPEKIKFEPQQWNRYSYVVNNPLKYVDPDGEDKLAAWLLGPSYADISTWDAILSRDTIAEIGRGKREFIADHDEATRGLSPFPTTKSGAMMPVFLGPLRIGGGLLSGGFRAFTKSNFAHTRTA